MKRLHLIVSVAVIAGMLVAAVPAIAGSGAPPGPHFNLNIIANSDKTQPRQDTNTHVIFVPLNGNCNIGLTPTPNEDGVIDTKDFQVLDGNCNDGSTVLPDIGSIKFDAAFMLPKPDAGLDGNLDYAVYVKVTSPKGSADMTTCYYDWQDAATYCSTGMTLNLSKTNYPKFQNVSKNLLTVCANTGTATDPNWQVKPLFWDDAYGYWWEYDNTGLRKASFRFYPNVSTAYPLNSACTTGGKW